MSEGNGVYRAEVDPGFVFDDLEPRVFPVRIRGKDYVLKSAPTGVAIQYRNACSKAARWEATSGKDVKVVGFDGLASTEVLLVQSCTFEVVQSKGEVRHGPVSRGWVEALPPAVTLKLYNKIVELSPCLNGSEPEPKPGPEGGGQPSGDDNPDGQGVEDSLPKGSPATTTGSS